MKISILTIIGTVIILMALTNPTEQKLREHLGKISDFETVSELHDYFVCSTYEYKYEGPDPDRHSIVFRETVNYFGILGFFIETGRYELTE